MLKRLSHRELLEQIAIDWQPQIRAAWVEAINAITSRIVLKRIVEKLERGDVAGAARDLEIEEGVFACFENALMQAYNSGGLAMVDGMPSLRDPSDNWVHFTWGVRNLPAEQASPHGKDHQHHLNGNRGRCHLRAGIICTAEPSEYSDARLISWLPVFRGCLVERPQLLDLPFPPDRNCLSGPPPDVC